VALFLIENQSEIWSADSFEVYVIANDGAMLRDAPSLKGKIVQKLAYGQSVEVMKELKDAETITLKDMPYSGVWFFVKSGQETGYIFSALVSPKFADEFVCDRPNLPQNIKISERDVQLELCTDGSFYMNEGYECKGTCSLHGCWRLKAGRIELSKRKQFRVKGIGKPIRCTHFCEYEKYRVETAVWAMQPYSDSYVQLDNFEKLVSEQKNVPLNLEFSPGSAACRNSYLFGKPR
jgi:hypothetical protein